MERDPVDLALEWTASENDQPIPVIMPAHERRPGGDWEAGMLFLIGYLSHSNSFPQVLCNRKNA